MQLQVRFSGLTVKESDTRINIATKFQDTNMFFNKSSNFLWCNLTMADCLWWICATWFQFYCLTNIIADCKILHALCELCILLTIFYGHNILMLVVSYRNKDEKTYLFLLDLNKFGGYLLLFANNNKGS